MKILKTSPLPGRPKAFWVGRRFRCGSCHTEVELEAGDAVKAETEKKPDGLTTLEFNCPACGNAMVWQGRATTPANELPPQPPIPNL